MLAASTDTILIPSVTSKILRLLDSLKRSEGGATIYNYIEQVIRDTEANCQQVEHAYANLLTLMLDTLAQQLPHGSSLQVQLKLLEMRLLPPLASADLKHLQDFLSANSDELTRGAQEADDIIESALSPLLASFNIRGTKPRAVNEEVPQSIPEMQPAVETELEQSPPSINDPDRRVDLSYRRHLDEKRQGIQRIQHALAQQVTSSIKHSQEFGALLDRQNQLLHQVNSQQEFTALKQHLIQETEKLQDGHRKLSAKLDETHNYLRKVIILSKVLSH